MTVFWLAAVLTFGQLTPPAGSEYKQVQLATSGDLVGATFGDHNRVLFTASRDGGRNWSAPVTAAEPGVISLGRHRGPRIAISGGAVVISVVAGAKGGGADGDLLVFRSTDAGKTWKPGARINDVPGSAREGLHAMAAGNGLVYAAWLDLRNHGTRLYGAVSLDAGVHWSANREIYASPDGSICQCCHPSLAIDAKGTIWVMWRNAIGGNRDLYLASSNDAGKTFSLASKLGAGAWKLDACPMDGGGLAIGFDGRPVSVWRRENQVFLARPGESERAIRQGRDPALAVGKEGVYVAWTSAQGVEIQSPHQSAPKVIDADGLYPQLLAQPDGGVLAAWERKGQIRFERLR